MQTEKLTRTRVRIISFITFVVSVLCVWAICEKVQKDRFEQAVITAQRRAIAQLCEYFDSMQTQLEKSEYANGVAMFARITSEVERNASGAKNALGTLDSGQTHLVNIYKYLSQAGAYTATIGKKLANGTPVTHKERETLRSLAQYAGLLHEKFMYMNDLMEGGMFSFDEVDATLESTAMADAVSYLSAAAGAEESFSDYPTLLYDGPFSDGVLQRESLFLKGQPEITETQAAEIAAEILGAPDAARLVADGQNSGKIETYNFYYEGREIQITKRGGHLLMLLSDAFAGETVYTGEDAVAIGALFLEKCGYKDMVSSYYATQDGICTVNFAYQQGDYICYPDLIKVSVSLTDGRVLSVDAASYLMNHHVRSLSADCIRISAAVRRLNPELRIRQIRKTVIPTAGGDEAIAFEFLCVNRDGQDALVYIDAVNGAETEIYLLLYSDGGTLTK